MSEEESVPQLFIGSLTRLSPGVKMARDRALPAVLPTGESSRTRAEAFLLRTIEWKLINGPRESL